MLLLSVNITRILDFYKQLNIYKVKLANFSKKSKFFIRFVLIKSNLYRRFIHRQAVTSLSAGPVFSHE
jgi:hypothetical protein